MSKVRNINFPNESCSIFLFMFCVVVKNTLNVNIPVFNIQQSFVSGIKRKWLSIGLQVTLQKKGNFSMEMIKTHIRNQHEISF